MGEIGLGGSTLVDIVNRIWSLSANAIDKIKEAATYVLNAVKAGLEFIANAALNAIIDAFVFLGNTFIQTLFSILESFLPSVASTQTNGIPGLFINGNTLNFGFSRDDTGLVLHFLSAKLKFSGIFSDTSVETLSLTETQTNVLWTLFAGEFLNTALIVIGRGMVELKKLGTASALFAGGMAASFLGNFFGMKQVIDQDMPKEDFSELGAYMIYFHLIAALSMFVGNLGSKAGNGLMSIFLDVSLVAFEELSQGVILNLIGDFLDFDEKIASFAFYAGLIFGSLKSLSFSKPLDKALKDTTHGVEESRKYISSKNINMEEGFTIAAKNTNGNLRGMGLKRDMFNNILMAMQAIILDDQQVGENRAYNNQVKNKMRQFNIFNVVYHLVMVISSVVMINLYNNDII